MGNPREELLEWLENLKASNTLIIVEGKKDRAALTNLGLTNIIMLEGPLYQNVEKIAELMAQLASRLRKAVILTDLDPEGKKLYSRLKKDLGEHGVEIDDRFREFLFRKTKLRQIEGMDTYLRNLD
jgi:5S rRNA maturation endonuclease (ribonuclease M5)